MDFASLVQLIALTESLPRISEICTAACTITKQYVVQSAGDSYTRLLSFH